ncbi:uncharacterized protein LOC131873958 [Cryptomeria japonica]|uniref:uncharacterized protein LOC131873958 n=1 Tax=Cryptomeria japonica TaxID=3369 RepID=UPI0027DA1F79|nr:uncharacterized protein LOC131873958 [Cryptomeria japonica]
MGGLVARERSFDGTLVAARWWSGGQGVGQRFPSSKGGQAGRSSAGERSCERWSASGAATRGTCSGRQGAGGGPGRSTAGERSCGRRLVSGATAGGTCSGRRGVERPAGAEAGDQVAADGSGSRGPEKNAGKGHRWGLQRPD